jgi:hypothetical protein
MRRLALSLEQGPKFIGRKLSENQLRVQFWTIVSRVLCFCLAFRVYSHEVFPCIDSRRRLCGENSA